MTQSEGAPVVSRADDLVARLRAAPGLLVGLDFDGTLAPIVPDPDAATAAPAVRRPLERLAAAEDVRVMICSGRALDDLSDRVPVDDVVLAGNHGFEVARASDRTATPATADARDAVARVRDRLSATLADVPGCRVEDKGPTLTVHVRETPADRVPAVRDLVETAVHDADDLRLSVGKAVFEVRPAADVDKGTAMARLQGDVPADWTTVYVGDDTTDEDAFRAVQPGGVGVYVAGADEPADAEFDTAADYALPGQAAVAPFLAWLADERTQTATERSDRREE